MLTWGQKRPNETPIANIILTLSFVHFVNLFTVYLFMLKATDVLNIFKQDNKLYVGLFFVVFH